MNIYQYFTHNTVYTKQIRSMLERGNKLVVYLNVHQLQGVVALPGAVITTSKDAFFNLSLCGGFYFCMV